MRKLRVLWTHNFNPTRPNSQVYMNVAAAGLRTREVDLHCEYLGNLRSVRNLWRARARVRRLSAAFDLVHAQYGSACSLATVTAVVPKVLSLRGNDWNVHQDHRSVHYIHTRLARAMTRSSISAYDCVLAESHRMAAEVRLRYPRVRIETFPAPIDLTRFVPRNRAEARAALGFADNAERWVLFNALNLNDPIKRFPLAQAAFDLANARHGRLRLRVATGLAHDELPLFVAACDLILCTSETEGWPNSVKEALACDVPFVSTDVSDLRDIAAREPSCHVCPGEPDALAAAILNSLEAPRPPSLRGHVKGMGLDASCDTLLGVYESLVAGPQPAALMPQSAIGA